MKTVNSQRASRPFVGLLLVATMTSLLVAPSPVDAVDFAIRPTRGASPIIAGTTQSVSVDVVITNDGEGADDALQGFQLAIAHDEQILSFDSISWAGTGLAVLPLNGGEGPDFYLVNDRPAGGGGITLGVVFQEQSLSFLLGAGEHVVSRAMYTALAQTGDTPTTIDFAASLGDPAIENKYTTRAGETLAPASTSGVEVAVADVAYSIHFGVAAIDAAAGQDVVVPIILQNSPQPVSGFSFGVTHPAGDLTFKELRTGAGLVAVIGELDDPPLAEDSPFFALNTSPDGGSGFTVALILSSTDETKVLDPLESPHTIFEAVYTAGPSAASAPVTISGDLGSPAVGVVIDLSGTSQAPLPPTPAPPTTSVIEIGGGSEGVPFVRGDADQSGSRNITDATVILNSLFAVQALNPEILARIEKCRDALDTNGDRGVNVSDTVYLLSFLFRNGPRPPAPFPSCGQPDSPAPPELKCLEFLACP